MKVANNAAGRESSEGFKVEFIPEIKESFSNKFVELLIRLLPNVKGGWLLYRFLMAPVPEGARKVTVEIGTNDCGGLLMVEFDLLDAPQFSMIKKRRYDLGTALTIWSLLREGDVFIDVGANSGFMSSVGSQKVGESGLVVSIEPNGEAFNFLVNRRLPNNIPLNRVGSDVSGKPFRLKKKFYRQTTSSYFIDGDGVKSITLDEVYKKFNKPSVRLVKIDTEGAELLIMKGARQLLVEKGPYVIIEIEEAHLKRYGYNLVDFEEFMREMGYGYYYFINNNDASIRSVDGIKDGEILFSKDTLTPDMFNL